MANLIEEMLGMKKWAVVGASRNTKKFGYQIFMLLLDEDYDVTPINPVYKDIEGEPTVKDLYSLEEPVDVVNVVVGVEKSKKVVEAAIDLGIKNLWFQPGTYNEEIIKTAEAAGINVVFEDCVLIEIGKRY